MPLSVTNPTIATVSTVERCSICFLLAYTEFYPFVQSVCYVLREKSFQSDLTARLTLFLNSSQETIKKLTSSIDLQQQLTEKIQYQQSIQETILNSALHLKDLARINMDKTQDILSNVIQAARHEYDLLKQVRPLSHALQHSSLPPVDRSVLYHKRFKPLFASRARIHSGSILCRCLRSTWSRFRKEPIEHGTQILRDRISSAERLAFHWFRSLLFVGMFLYVVCERYYQMSSVNSLRSFSTSARSTSLDDQFLSMASDVLDLLFHHSDSICRQVPKPSRNQQRAIEPHHRGSGANRSDVSSCFQRAATRSFEISFTVSFVAITSTTATATTNTRRETHVSVYGLSLTWTIGIEFLRFHLVIDDLPRTRLPLITYDENKENTPRMTSSSSNSHNYLLEDEDDDDDVDLRFSIHGSSKRHYSLLLSQWVQAISRKKDVFGEKFRSSKSNRKLLGQKNRDNNV